MSLNKENILTKSNRSNNYTLEFEAMLRQYERLTEDWGFQRMLIWEIPTVAI